MKRGTAVDPNTVSLGLRKMSKDTIAIFIISVSILVASLSLGWNIYRDIILKAKLKVRFMVGLITHPNLKKPLDRLIISATNFGPGKIKCSMIFIKNSSIWKKIFHKTKIAVLIHDYTDPLSANFPCELDIGDCGSFFLKNNEDCFLLEDWTHIGISDSFGRIHWAPKKNIKEAKKAYKKKLEKRGIEMSSRNEFRA